MDRPAKTGASAQVVTESMSFEVAMPYCSLSAPWAAVAASKRTLSAVTDVGSPNLTEFEAFVTFNAAYGEV